MPYAAKAVAVEPPFPREAQKSPNHQQHSSIPQATPIPMSLPSQIC